MKVMNTDFLTMLYSGVSSVITESLLLFNRKV